ncbi:hypothetical protein CSUI_004950 [Cystoisospora suis]|uniref:Uncharacterized protein n=1 Tax=Cystoisospora suis TaxID=483139 RepID=A0A2C6KWX0_9APIC|nr:hypothetical protein CSUI_004950 [Cystoisospora suis]
MYSCTPSSYSRLTEKKVSLYGYRYERSFTREISFLSAILDQP